MQAAYEEFMLGKSKVPKSPTPVKNYGADKNRSDSKKKGHRPILRALQGRLEEWKDTSQKLEGVLRSISNLRDRIYWESSSLATRHRNELQPWRQSGFRSSFGNRKSNHVLMKDDIQLALDHDLLQHERMLSGVRSLVASLAQLVDEIGRRLDEWMLQNLIDQSEHVLDERMLAMQLKEQSTFELAQEVYSLLATDLYQKQKMATRVFDSCHDGVFVGSHEKGETKSLFQSDPRDVIKQTSKELSNPERKNLVLSHVNKLLAIS